MTDHDPGPLPTGADLTPTDPRPHVTDALARLHVTCTAAHLADGTLVLEISDRTSQAALASYLAWCDLQITNAAANAAEDYRRRTGQALPGQLEETP